MFKLYEFEGQEYVLVKDVATAWYPNSISRKPTTPVRNRLQQANIPVTQIRTVVDGDGKRAKSILIWAFPASHLDKVNALETRHSEVVAREEEDEMRHGCVFYVIQKYPEDAPQIIKLGKTTKSAEARSRAFYVWNPKILREFPINPNDEKTLIRMIGNGCKQIGDEEFVVEDIESLLSRADTAASLLGILDEELDEELDAEL